MDYWLSEHEYWDNHCGFNQGIIIPSNINLGLDHMAHVSENHHFTENLLCINDRFSQQFGVLNRNGEVIVDFQYDMIFPFHQGFAVFEKNQKYGFLNQFGKEIIPAIYDDATSNSQDCFVVEKENRWFCVNEANERIFTFHENMRNPSHFIGQFAVVENSNRDEFAIINQKHDFVIDFGIYENIQTVDYEGWYRFFAVQNQWGYGFLNEYLETVIPCQFSHFYFDPIRKQLLVAHQDFENLMYINQQGKIIGKFLTD